MRFALALLMLAPLAALPAQALGDYTSVSYVGVEVEFHEGSGIYDPSNVMMNGCFSVVSVDATGHVSGPARTNLRTVLFQGVTQGFDGSPTNVPVDDPTDIVCFDEAADNQHVGYSPGDVNTGSSLYFGFNFDDGGIYAAPSVTLSLCPLGSETIHSGSLDACAGGFLPVALPTGKDLIDDPYFLSELALPATGFLRICYEAQEWDAATSSFVAKEQQDYVVAVTWDDLNNHPETVVAAFEAATIPPVLGACT